MRAASLVRLFSFKSDGLLQQMAVLEKHSRRIILVGRLADKVSCSNIARNMRCSLSSQSGMSKSRPHGHVQVLTPLCRKNLRRMPEKCSL